MTKRTTVPKTPRATVPPMLAADFNTLCAPSVSQLWTSSALMGALSRALPRATADGRPLSAGVAARVAHGRVPELVAVALDLRVPAEHRTVEVDGGAVDDDPQQGTLGIF